MKRGLKGTTILKQTRNTTYDLHSNSCNCFSQFLNLWYFFLLSSHHQLIYTLPEMWYLKLGTVLQQKGTKGSPHLTETILFIGSICFLLSHSMTLVTYSTQPPDLPPAVEVSILLHSLCIWLFLTVNLHMSVPKVILFFRSFNLTKLSEL